MNCIYFTGIRNKQCKKGHVYEHFRQGALPLFKNLPCIKDNTEISCSDKETTEPEQPSKKDMKEASNGLRALRMVMDFIDLHDVPKNQPLHGQIDCPICNQKGGIIFDRHHNGHIHLHCQTCHITLLQ